MLLSDIEPIANSNVNLLNNDANGIIDEVIELPLREACKIFREKGIETVMSSANKNNLLKVGEKAIEKKDIYGSFEKLFERHTFIEAGKGYAWIMINFDTLSFENKNLLFELEKSVGEKLIWFVHPFEMSDKVEYALRIGKYDYDFIRQIFNEEDIPKNIKIDEMLIEFEKRHIVLLYPWTDSSTEAVFLRMPINEQTTVDEVEKYFSTLAQQFKKQIDIKKNIK